MKFTEIRPVLKQLKGIANEMDLSYDIYKEGSKYNFLLREDFHRGDNAGKSLDLTSLQVMYNNVYNLVDKLEGLKPQFDLGTVYNHSYKYKTGSLDEFLENFTEKPLTSHPSAFRLSLGSEKVMYVTLGSNLITTDSPVKKVNYQKLFI